MQFVKLTHDILHCLMEQGYTIIRSASPLSSENPSWFPDTISVEEHLLWEDKQFRKHDFGFEGTHVLVIVDALEELREEDLIGEVWILSTIYMSQHDMDVGKPIPPCTLVKHAA